MIDRTVYLDKLRAVAAKEEFWSAGYLGEQMGLSVNCVKKVLNVDNETKIANRTMMKIKMFLERYDKENDKTSF